EARRVRHPGGRAAADRGRPARGRRKRTGHPRRGLQDAGPGQGVEGRGAAGARGGDGGDPLRGCPGRDEVRSRRRSAPAGAGL
ncbi:MAG: hypothetical protein AVDCRST_MAG01-01-874, partial [uncultured Rubrobacteraceae bacterium]